MPHTNYHIYCDASFNNNKQIGIAAFLIYNNDSDHISCNFSNAFIQTNKIRETNNIRVELKGVIWALTSLAQKYNVPSIPDFKIYLFTDCKSISNLILRKLRLESKQFLSNRTKKPLMNSDLYKEFFTIYKQLYPKIIWIKGHSPNIDKDYTQRNFSYIDKMTRRLLRGL